MIVLFGKIIYFHRNYTRIDKGGRIMLDQSYFTGIRGAVYFPARAYNAYQTYSLFDAAVIDRDFGYAQ